MQRLCPPARPRPYAVVGRCRLTLLCPRTDPAWFQRLNLKYDGPLSNFACFAFECAVRRYGAGHMSMFFTIPAHKHVSVFSMSGRACHSSHGAHIVVSGDPGTHQTYISQHVHSSLFKQIHSFTRPFFISTCAVLFGVSFVTDLKTRKTDPAKSAHSG